MADGQPLNAAEVIARALGTAPPPEPEGGAPGAGEPCATQAPDTPAEPAPADAQAAG